MEIRLGQSIRHLRKQSGFTQEQLAEALGVSVSAVHKWESGKANPELEMLVDIAEFFETSVDAILNYGWEKLSMGRAAEKIRQFCIGKELEEGMRFAEKMLQKYPNSFDIALRSAEVYFLTMKPEYMPRAVELYEKAITLVAKNEDAQFYVMTIQERIAYCYSYMDKMDDAITILEKNNLNGMNNSKIGLFLSNNPEKADEALDVLSDALLKCYTDLYETCIGYANAYGAKKDLGRIAPLIMGVYELGNRLRDPGVINWVDRGNVRLLTILAEAERLRGNEAAARGWLLQARDTARKFDAAPNYRTGAGLLFYIGSEKATNFDDAEGSTATDMIESLLSTDEIGQGLRLIWEDLQTEA